MSTIPVHLKYTLPGAAAPSEDLLAVSQSQLDRALVILRGQEPEPAPQPVLADKAQAFVQLLNTLQYGLTLLDTLGQEIISPTELVSLKMPIPAVKLEDLRAVGSGPKQIASLLGCEAGFFDSSDPAEIVCLFSPVRFAPTANFFDMRQQ